MSRSGRKTRGFKSSYDKTRPQAAAIRSLSRAIERS
jgi:hypothetical protein